MKRFVKAILNCEYFAGLDAENAVVYRLVKSTGRVVANTPTEDAIEKEPYWVERVTNRNTFPRKEVFRGKIERDGNYRKPKMTKKDAGFRLLLWLVLVVSRGTSVPGRRAPATSGVRNRRTQD